jgi:hypothetical protein
MAAQVPVDADAFLYLQFSVDGGVTPDQGGE